MERRNFADVLRSAKVDIEKEYNRLYDWFYTENFSPGGFNVWTLHDQCDSSFSQFPKRGTCISLSDFEDTYGFNFEKCPDDFNTNYLINFCEYSYNITLWTNNYSAYNDQVMKVIELVGYTSIANDIFTVFVPKDLCAISVSEIVDEKLAYLVLDYNHHTMKGNLDAKLTTLKRMADDIEPHRKELAQINKAFSEQLFQMLNKFIRHTHEKTPYIQTLSDEEIESYYDDIYQMWLLAKLELDNVERRRRIDAVLKVING